MGCFSIPKNKSKVAAASQTNNYYGTKLEQLLSSNKPVLLPDPDDLPGGQSQGAGPLPPPTSVRGGGGGAGGKQGHEKRAISTATAGSIHNSSSRLIDQHARALSDPVNYHSLPPAEDHLPIAHSGGGTNIPAIIPFSAPLDGGGASSPAPLSPPAPAAAVPPLPSCGSPLHSMIVSAGASEVITRNFQQGQGLDKKVTKAFTEKKAGSYSGRPVRLPKPQGAAAAAAAHPLPLPHPPELEEAPAAPPAAAAGTAVGGLATSVSPSPNRGKDGTLGVGALNNYGFLSMGGGNPVEALPLPPPALPTHSRTPVRAFPYGELAHALVPGCLVGEGGFGRAYRAWVDDHAENSSIKKKVEVAVVCPVVKALQGLRGWMAEVNWLARLQDPRLCKLIGYCAEDVPGVGNRRFLVYEFLNKGSLDMFVKGKDSSRRMDWSTRMRVALDIAQGLAYLHDKAPFQVICRDLSSTSIQLDNDLRAKLSGFGLARCGPEGDQGLPMAGPYVAPESGTNGLVTIKSNAWSFGVLLLELLTGRRHMDSSFPSGQQNLVQLTKPFLRDEGKLFLIMDPELNGRYSGRGALKVANLAFQCLIKEASLRPNLSEAVEVLRTVQTDEESLTGDLKKSRSLTQSVGSPVTYSRSTSDHFVQRTANSSSLTSSPSGDPKQRDREFLKSAALGSSTWSPSHVEPRVPGDLKQPKSIFGDRDAQKVPIHASQQSFEPRQHHLDINQQRELDMQKLAAAHFVETTTLSSPFTDTKQPGLRKVASYGTLNSALPFSDYKRPSSPNSTLPFSDYKRPSSPNSALPFSDYKRPSSPVLLQGRGEAKRLQLPTLTGLVPHTEFKQQSGDQEALQYMGREPKRFQTSQSAGSSQYSEIKQRSPEAWRFPTPESSSSLPPGSSDLKEQSSPEGMKLPVPQSSSSSSSLLPKSGELKQRSPEGWKFPAQQSSSFRPHSGELKPSSSWRPHSGELRPSSSWRPHSGELKPSSSWRPQSGELKASSSFRPHSGELKWHSDVRKLPTPQSSSSLLPSSGELRQQNLEAGSIPRSGGELKWFSEARKLPTPQSSSSLLPSSGELKQQSAEAAPVHPNARKLPVAAPVGGDSHQPDLGEKRRHSLDLHRLPSFNRSSEGGHGQLNELKKMEEQDLLKSPSARSSASSRSSCAPALTFDPPMIREEFCVW